MDWSHVVDYCGVFISCLDSHSDGTHSLQRIHWWATDVMLNFSKSILMKKQAHIQLGLRVSTYLANFHFHRLFFEYFYLSVSFFIPHCGSKKHFLTSLTATLVEFRAGLIAASSIEMTLFSFKSSKALVHSSPRLSTPETHKKLEGNHR